jgi:hypothetical protein
MKNDRSPKSEFMIFGFSDFGYAVLSDMFSDPFPLLPELPPCVFLCPLTILAFLADSLVDVALNALR